MKKILCLLLFSLTFFAEELDPADQGSPNFQHPLFVSLGSHCEAAVMLGANGLRCAAYPFDWLVTVDHEGLLSLLQDDFHYFLDKDHLFPYPGHPGCIENARYKIEMKHDGPFLLEGDLWHRVVEKYQRRIERFRQIRDFPGKVFFLRTAYDLPEGGPTYWLQKSTIDSQNAKSLKQALEQFFPKLDFTLIILNYFEDFPTPIEEMEGVIEFKIHKFKKHSEYKTYLHKLQCN